MIVFLTYSLVLCSLYDIFKIIRKHFISKAWSFLSVSVFKVQLSRPWASMATTRLLNILMFVAVVMLLLCHICLRLTMVGVAWLILAFIYSFELPSDDILAPRYFNDFTCSMCSPFIIILVFFSLHLFVYYFAFLLAHLNVTCLCSRLGLLLIPVVLFLSPHKVNVIRKVEWLITLQMTETVLLKSSSVSCIMFSRKRLSNTGDSRHHWRPPTVVWNGEPICPPFSTALVEGSNSFSFTFRIPSSMLYRL